MTSKLKCPFCQQDLFQTAEPLQYCCMNKDCPSGFTLAGTPQLWTALIQAKQDLKIATNALREICNDYQEDSTERAEKALKQIEHKE